MPMLAESANTVFCKEEGHSRNQLIGTLSNSRRRRQIGRPEVKMQYLQLPRMSAIKLESSFSHPRSQSLRSSGQRLDRRPW